MPIKHLVVFENPAFHHVIPRATPPSYGKAYNWLSVCIKTQENWHLSSFTDISNNYFYSPATATLATCSHRLQATVFNLSVFRGYSPLAIIYRYFHGYCSAEPANRTTPSSTTPRCTGYDYSPHYLSFSVHISIIRVTQDPDGFHPVLTKLHITSFSWATRPLAITRHAQTHDSSCLPSLRTRLLLSSSQR